MEVVFRPLCADDIPVMGPVLADDGMAPAPGTLEGFFTAPNACAFGAFVDHALVGMAYCYLLPRPDGDTMFFVYSIGILPQYQNQGIGSGFMSWLSGHAESIGCSKLFVVTEKSNVRACRIYEKAGGQKKHEDDVVYAIPYR